MHQKTKRERLEPILAAGYCQTNGISYKEGPEKILFAQGNVLLEFFRTHSSDQEVVLEDGLLVAANYRLMSYF